MSTLTQPKRVLAVDPGFDRVGVAILEKNPAGEVLLHSECIRTNRKDSKELRLKEIGEKIEMLISAWKPTDLAIETLFFNQNTSSALGVAEGRGVIIYEAVCGGLSVYEYSPQAVKIAVTGYGKATKLQMESMIPRLIKVTSRRKMLDDELDAIALGITHLASSKDICYK